MQKVYVDFATGEARFLLNDKTKLEPVIDSINKLGYKVVDSKQTADNAGKLTTIDKRFYFTLPFTIVLFLVHHWHFFIILSRYRCSYRFIKTNNGRINNGLFRCNW